VCSKRPRSWWVQSDFRICPKAHKLAQLALPLQIIMALFDPHGYDGAMRSLLGSDGSYVGVETHWDGPTTELDHPAIIDGQLYGAYVFTHPECNHVRPPAHEPAPSPPARTVPTSLDAVSHCALPRGAPSLRMC